MTNQESVGHARADGQRGAGSQREEEIARIRAKMTELRDAGDLGSPTLRRLEDINQAVSWANDPDSCRAPFDQVMADDQAA